MLLHACCAPCSSAIVEWMLQHDVRPTIFYFNPNIYPLEEYTIRKEESKRHAESLGLQWIDGDYDHQRWLETVRGLEGEPERGSRCLQCFSYRLKVAALQAKALGLEYFTTTLASSRWKSLEQITEAGLRAQAAVPGTIFWAQNWRKGGLHGARVDFKIVATNCSTTIISTISNTAVASSACALLRNRKYLLFQ